MAYEDWGVEQRSAAKAGAMYGGTIVERRVRIGRGKPPVALVLTFEGAPPAPRAHQAMP